MASGDSPRALTGMRDVLSPETARRRAAIACFRSVFEAAGYEEVATPVMEDAAVFLRVGEGTDVVTKEMYTFTDRDGTLVALRPETTASVVRAFLQHHPLTPWKVWYVSEHFRHERPQRGRLRQHTQFGAEVIGSGDPDVDVEVVVALWDAFAALGLQRNRLLLNSIGEPSTRAAFAERLKGWLRGRVGSLDPDDRERVEQHPLRVLDSKRPDTVAAIEGHPTLLEEMSADERDRFERVQAGVRAAGIPFEIEPRLVRGLDYYTHTVFEVVNDAIDASQSTIGGGGRYDGLVAAMGGEQTPGMGFGAGIERVLLACDAEGAFEVAPTAVDCFVVAFGGDGSDARDLCRELRRGGVSVDRAFDGRSPKSQMKAADRSGARVALLLGDDERRDGTVTVRDLRDRGDQQTVSRDDLLHHLGRHLA